jgi:hypothetical protein
VTLVTDKPDVTHTCGGSGRNSSFRLIISLCYDHHPSWHSGGRVNLSLRSRVDLILKCNPVLAQEFLPSPPVSPDSVPAFWPPTRQDSQGFPGFRHNQRVMDNSRADSCPNSRGSHSSPPNFNNQCRLASQVNSDNKELLPPFLQSLPSFSNNKALFNHSNLTGFSAHLLAQALVAP